MYILPEMIEMGLLKDQEFPTEAHRKVASNLGLCNPLVVQRDTLIEVVQSVLRVPIEEIESVTIDDMIYKYNCPHVVKH
jgi:hypothetical protein